MLFEILLSVWAMLKIEGEQSMPAEDMAELEQDIKRQLVTVFN